MSTKKGDIIGRKQKLKHDVPWSCIQIATHTISLSTCLVPYDIFCVRHDEILLDICSLGKKVDFMCIVK